MKKTTFLLTAMFLVATSAQADFAGPWQWGRGQGTLAAQTDLQNALDAKQSTSLSNGQILVGNGSSMAAGVTPSGDVTMTNTGVTSIGAAKVTNAMLRNSTGLSVMGRSTNSPGVPADMVAATDGHVLRRSGTTLGFGAIALGSSAAVTGTLSAPNGGTGQASYTVGDMLYANATNSLARIAPNTMAAAKYLRQIGNGTAANAPAWSYIDAADVLPASDPGMVTYVNNASVYGGDANFTWDESLHAFRVGDPSYAFNGTSMQLDDANSILNLSNLYGTITMGDPDGMLTNFNVMTNAGYETFSILRNGALMFSIDGLNREFSMGDRDGNYNYTYFAVNDNAQQITGNINGQPYLQLDYANGLYSIGDVSNLGAGTQLYQHDNNGLQQLKGWGRIGFEADYDAGIVTIANTLRVGFGGDATIASGGFTAKHYAGNSTTPSISAGTGAGTSPSIAVTGNDVSGHINLTTGTSPAGSNATLATLTFAIPYSNAPIVVFTPANKATAEISGTQQIYPTTTTTALTIKGGNTALSAATAYVWNYHVFQ